MTMQRIEVHAQAEVLQERLAEVALVQLAQELMAPAFLYLWAEARPGGRLQVRVCPWTRKGPVADTAEVQAAMQRIVDDFALILQANGVVEQPEQPGEERANGAADPV